MSAMTDRQKSCEERIDGELSDRLESIDSILKRENSENEEEREEAMEEWAEYPLSVGVKRVVTVLLSTGGPADWFEATLDDEGQIERIEYVYQDWFDGARRVVQPETDEWDKAERFLSYFTEVL